MAIAISFIAGSAVGAIAMLLLVKETQLDLSEKPNVVVVREIHHGDDKTYKANAPELELPWEAEDLMLPEKEIKYGNF